MNFNCTNPLQRLATKSSLPVEILPQSNVNLYWTAFWKFSGIKDVYLYKDITYWVALLPGRRHEPVETLYKSSLLDLDSQELPSQSGHLPLLKPDRRFIWFSLVSRSSRNTKPRNDTIEIYLYIRIDDDDNALRYLQLLKVLELDFRSATTTSASSCSSQIVGL